MKNNFIKITLILLLNFIYTSKVISDDFIFNISELEITENVLMDEPQVIIDALVQLKAQGISIALDDFGTGFSSLSYLQKLILEILKGYFINMM